MFSLICTWINSWVNNREAGDLRRHRAHYDVMVMLSQFPASRCFPNLTSLWKHTLAIEYHVYIWQVSPQPSCGDTCQIWMWFKESKKYFCKIKNVAYGEINEHNFSNPHPSTIGSNVWIWATSQNKNRYPKFQNKWLKVDTTAHWKRVQTLGRHQWIPPTSWETTTKNIHICLHIQWYCWGNTLPWSEFKLVMGLISTTVSGIFWESALNPYWFIMQMSTNYAINGRQFGSYAIISENTPCYHYPASKVGKACNLYFKLTHWRRDEIGNISQTFPNVFASTKMFEFRLEFHWSVFLRVQLTLFQHWLRYSPGAVQATSDYLNQWWLVYRRI